jgi:hypothetical protein
VQTATAPRPAPPPPPPPPPRIDAEAVVGAGGWRTPEGEPSALLPSSLSSCLSQGEGKLVCFSQPLQSNLEGQGVTYVVKATLTGFREDGGFEIQPLYQVTDVQRRPAEGVTAEAPIGLAATEGWIDPTLTARCTARSASAISCQFGDRRLEFVRP